MANAVNLGAVLGKMGVSKQKEIICSVVSNLRGATHK